MNVNRFLKFTVTNIKEINNLLSKYSARLNPRLEVNKNPFESDSRRLKNSNKIETLLKRFTIHV